MANFDQKGKWKRRIAAGLTAALALSLSMGIFAACTTDDEEEDDSNTVAARTDTQLIKNGDFEFYSEMTKTEIDEKRAFLNTPNSWTSTSNTPTSDTKSGLVDVTEFDYIAKSSFSLISSDDTEASDAIAYAVAHWNEASLYDRLEFYDHYDDEIDDLDSSSEAAELFADYVYSVDFEDVETLNEELGGEILLHDNEAQRENGNTGVLMIHNSRTSNNVRGTSQYYTSSTTVTLDAGTSAKVSVWVKTSNLYHYYADDDVTVTQRAGAYIGVTNTVGGTTLSQMQIKNINTEVTSAGSDENNGWEQYTVYIRANTFATSTFTIVLGLGQGSSDDRYEQVDGYAFFDDLECTILSNADYEAAVGSDMSAYSCTVDSKAEEKLFDATENASYTARTYALDLYAGDNDETLNLDDAVFDLTTETSGSKDYTSADIDGSLADNRGEGDRDSITAVTNLSELAATQNGYLKTIYENDFKDKFPFGGENPDDVDIVMLLSTNGAAYTATLPSVTLEANSRMLVSFFVKTSEIITGRSGAAITLVDGENKTSIAAFDSTTVATVDIDDDNTDIYNGWVQCFFFVTNDEDTEMTFHLELSYGPTAIVGTSKSAYGQGYAAFTNFETRSLTKAQVSYASTGDRAVSVSLTGSVEGTSAFDSVSATTNIENGLARPSSFQGVLGGSKHVLAGSETDNPIQSVLNEQYGIYTGLLNVKYADSYRTLGEAWVTPLVGDGGDDWWKTAFGSEYSAKVARQPLVIMNTSDSAQPSYGFLASSVTLSSATYQRISMRVKASVGTNAYIYLVDTSSAVSAGYLSPDLPAVTYWYDDDGNICASDPTAKDYKKKTGILYYLEENGLYTKANSSDGTYYANLWNYEQSGDNLVTKDGTVAFYGYDGDYYAYYDEDTDTYSTKVVCLPKTEGDTVITRYDYSESAMPQSKIVVEGTGDWVDVSFYIYTGNESKSYRLEVWAGSRDYDGETDTDGIAAEGYVFFDNYSSSTITNYDSLLSEAVDALKADPDNLVDADDLTSNLKDALYYTFTFYDSLSYLRYDVNEDEDETGNLYASYTQSGYSEKLVYLAYNDAGGSQTGTPSMSIFLDYSATDVTVTPDSTSSSDTDDTTSDTETDMNVWLAISSGALALVLLFAIVAVIVRRLRKKYGKKTKVKRTKTKRVKPVKEGSEAEPQPEAEKHADQDDPYNE